jgi:hypothetical protein
MRLVKMSSDNEKTPEQLRQETADFMEKNMPKRINNVPVTKEQADKIRAILLKKKGENMNENENDVEKLREELESEKDKSESLESTLKLIAEKEINKKIAELDIPEKEQEFFRQNPEALKGFELGKSNQKDSGKGSLKMTSDMIRKERGSENDKREFNSPEEMLEWCRINDKPAYEAIKLKTYRGMVENKGFSEWADTFDENGNSLIKRTLLKMDKEARKKLGHKESE